MPRKPPPKETRFKPGQSGNPGGQAKLPDDIKEARKLNQIELERTVNKFLFADREALHAVIKAPETPMLELMVASIMAKAAQNGDQVRLEFILCRLIGKVQDRIEVKTPVPFVIARRDGETLILGAKIEDEK